MSTFDGTPTDDLGDLDELRVALAEADAVSPPDELAPRLERSARQRRAPGRPVDAPAPASAVEVFAAAVASMDALASSLSDEEWARTTVRGLSVQGLLGHLVGVERALAEAIVSPSADAGASVGVGHVDGTVAAVDEQRGRPPADTLDDWRAASAATLDLVGPRSSAPDGLSEVVVLFELALTLEHLLVVRAFELWTHEEDVRRATGRPLAAPPPSSLYTMTSLAVSLLPLVVDPQTPERRVSLVLTGQGGGTWRMALGPAGEVPEVAAPDRTALAAATPDARIVADVVDFCRVAANRLDPDDLGYHVDGDRALAREVLSAATTLALD